MFTMKNAEIREIHMPLIPYSKIKTSKLAKGINKMVNPMKLANTDFLYSPIPLIIPI